MNHKDNQTDRIPQFPDPYWKHAVQLPTFSQLKEDIQVDVAVVGGGISGITSAYLLSKEGLKVALIDAGQLLNGTTGHTTAKITAQHDLIYDELIRNANEHVARLYYRANDEALQLVRQIIEEHNIECGYSEQDAYIYANSDTELRKITAELEAYGKLGIPSAYAEGIPLPIPSTGAIIMKNQAQFNPLQYLSKLLEYIVEQGGQIYEHTTAIDVEEDGATKVITRNGKQITCKYVLSCSHFPFDDGLNFYFARMYAERSYVLGIKSKESFPGGMYLSAGSPKRSIRYTPTTDGEQLLLIGGENHKTGQGICTIKHYEALQEFAEEHFEVQEISYRWSAQDLTTSDKIPYIGQLTPRLPNVFVATGFRKWGMTNSTAAAALIRDLIIGRENPYQELYTPTRFKAETDVKNLVEQNLDVAKHLIGGKLDFVQKKPEELANGEGAAVTIGGARAGAYKDEAGELYIVDTTCTHMGCEVEWNAGDLSWDCPCHGSRFSVKGEVMEGPAKKPLRRISLESN